MASQGANEAYATLITSDDFLPGVQVLAYSLREAGATRPLVVLATEQVSAHTRKRLDEVGQVVQVGRLAAPGGGTHVEGWANAAYSKLHVFGLTRWRKLVYVDADCMVVRNVDEVRADGTPPRRLGVSPRRCERARSCSSARTSPSRRTCSRRTHSTPA